MRNGWVGWGRAAAVTKPVAKGAFACQWTGDGPVINLFTFAPGQAKDHFDDTREAWIQQKATITDVPGVGDRAFLATRSSLPITHLVVLAGDSGFDIQSNASDDELAAIAKAAVPRLPTLPAAATGSTTTTAA